MADPETYLTAKQVAERWGVSAKSVRLWGRTRAIPAPVRINLRTLRWRLSELRRHEQKHLKERTLH